MKALIGMGVALVTPFKQDGSVDHKALARALWSTLPSCLNGVTKATPIPINVFI